jgi:hypothetical protein
MDTHFADTYEIADAGEEVRDDPETKFLGWTLAPKHVVRTWWVPVLLRRQGIVHIRVPRAQIRKIVAFDEPEVLDEAPHAYTKRALEWGSFNAAALLM